MLNSEMLHLFLETNKQKSNAVLFGGGREGYVAWTIWLLWEGRGIEAWRVQWTNCPRISQENESNNINPKYQVSLCFEDSQK